MNEYSFLILAGGTVIDHAPTIRKARKKGDIASYAGLEGVKVVRTFVNAHAPGTVAYFTAAQEAEYFGIDDSETFAFRAI